MVFWLFFDALAGTASPASSFLTGSGGAASAFIERLIRCASGSTERTNTSTWSPSWTTSEARHTRLCDSSEMWTSPSMPGSNSTKAPNSISLVTVPRTTLWGGYFWAAAVQGLSSRSRYARLILPVAGVDLLDPHLDRLPFVEHVAGMLDPAPRQLADVQQAVDAAEVDEGPEIHQLSHHAVADLARLERVEHLLAELLALAFQHGAAAQDQVPPVGIGLGNHAGHPLVDELGKVFHAVQGDLAHGDEAADVVDFAFQPARVVPGHADLDHRALDKIGPVVDLHGLIGNRQLVHLVFGVEPLHDHLDDGARPRAERRTAAARRCPAGGR